MYSRPLPKACFVVAALLTAQLAGAQTPPAAQPADPAAPVAPAAPPAPPKMVPNEGVIKVGGELKQTRGRITDIDKGDNGCYFTFRDDKKNELIEVGKFELCALKPSPKGKLVEFQYNIETIQAGDCYGDPKCKKTETVPVIVTVKVLE